ncbi:MAG TPA: PAS domain-containing protein [Ferrovibrio sp.]|jgi:hypothetical protein|uniref:PAS domain-containing protein n=1 Tax=Ferrovibrio sp. TaxID=1917215 RepID=UPI002B4B0F9E|nr:PAS domain-containing protein [Ferrovibrio sp.]HLT76041.1 PAS domain-containing protein [Ferrovibrio sp.]
MAGSSSSPPAPPAASARERGFTAAQIRSKSLSNLLGYWSAKRQHLGRLPARADLQPEEMLPFLPFVALITVQESSPRFQFRLVGTGIVSALGQEATSRAVDQSLLGANVEEVERFFSIPVQSRMPAYASGEYMVAPSNRGLGFETLLVPLSGDGARVDMLLGGLVGERIHREERISQFHYHFYCPLTEAAAPVGAAAILQSDTQ